MPLVAHIALLLVTAIVLAVVLGVGLWWAIGQPSITTGKPWTPKETFDFVKIVLAIVGGIGAVVALVVAYRKQRLGEAAEKRQQAAEVREDARLFGEDFARATEQLGSTEAPVRLAGMYTLERLGQDTPEQQQTIVNVLCAYLRMPYTLPNPEASGAQEGNERRKQEREVRITAQRILASNLRFREGSSTQTQERWENIDLDLTGATLLDFNFRSCKANRGLFGGAKFVGEAWFTGAQFAGDAWFTGAQFAGNARFDDAQLDKRVWFARAQFDEGTWFSRAKFGGEAWFSRAKFGGEAWFSGAQFGGEAWFSGAQFAGKAWFISGVQFGGEAWFTGAQFAGDAWFTGAEFAGNARFDDAQFREAARLEPTWVRLDVPESVLNDRTWPPGYDVSEPASPEEKHLHGREGQWGYLTLVDPHGPPATGLDNPESGDTAEAN